MNVSASNGTSLIIPPYETKLIFSVICVVLYIVIIVAGVIGNTLVLLAFCLSPALRISPTNYFIMSLAISDILTVTLSIPFDAEQTLLGWRWNHGSFVCSLWTTIYLFVVPSSILSLLAVSVDRYKSLVDPLNRFRQTSGYPRPDVVWSKNNGTLPHKRAVVDSTGKLHIKHVTTNDSGIYQCKASNLLGRTQTTAKLQVKFRPRLTLGRGPIYTKIGDDIRLPMCHVTGFPLPKVTWSKAIGSLPKSRSAVKEGQLAILKSKKHDSGLYVCKGENLLGSAVGSVVVNVIDLPVFVVKPLSSYIAPPGSTVMLNCTAKGDPQPVITWRKDNGVLPIGRFELRDGSLIIRNVKKTDSGVFVCTATSAGVFDTESRTTLTVQHEDCSELYKSGERRNGVYTVQPDNQPAFQVYCDMTTDGGGWTVIQRRQDGSVDFYRNWQQYKTGFGNLNGEFWLGNDYIHRLTARTASSLRVELEDWDGTRKYAKYGSFSVGDESDKYRLRVGSYSGTAGDSLSYHNNMAFTTKDRDNDKDSRNCATQYIGAWWYEGCHHSNLNGKYLGNKLSSQGITWYHFHGKYQSLKTSSMKIRANNF
ncbi:Fibrinogen C domain-containing protein 1 [Exaiptasia diaphana]|nr:Fibrinogen C domain-containing protein 1 [Exaiptasia diaphana]